MSETSKATPRPLAVEGYCAKHGFDRHNETCAGCASLTDLIEQRDRLRQIEKDFAVFKQAAVELVRAIEDSGSQLYACEHGQYERIHTDPEDWRDIQTKARELLKLAWVKE